MAIQPLMTWAKERKGWMKSYKGKMHAVSCKQLNTPPTKDQSVLAANCWWQSKQAALDAEDAAAAPPAPGTPAAQLALLQAFAGQPLQTQEDMAAALSALTADRLPSLVQQAVLGPERLQQLQDAIQALLDGTAPATRSDRAISAQVEDYVNILRLNVKQKLISIVRFADYSRTLRSFAQWAGPESDVNILTAQKLEAYWASLALKVTEKEYAPASAATVFRTVKMFIRRLGEYGLIPLPGNIASRRFRFNEQPGEVSRYSVDEVKAMLAKAADRTKLYILLACNCGMYQGDIADLGDDEVDWTEGTITRPRSKTPKGPKVTYRLWPETFALLRKLKATVKVSNGRGSNRVLLTCSGKPLVEHVLREDGGTKSNDRIRDNFIILSKKLKLPQRLKIKLLRKTAASELGSHPAYGAYTQYFLAHSPRGVADRHYIKPDDMQFQAALEWLRGRFLS